MKLINDERDPDLLGLIQTKNDFAEVVSMVNVMNQDLRDSGFEQYQFKAERKGKKAYIRRVENL